MSLINLTDEYVHASMMDEIVRERARRGLLNFTSYTFPEYKVALHNQFIAACLDLWVKREIPRLMIFAPPRSGKSELVSRRLPPCILGTFPKSKIMATSYAADLAYHNSRRAREIMRSVEYSHLYSHVKLNPDRYAVEDWETLNGGEYKCAGVRGGITGRGYHYGIIDDPVSDRGEAESPTVRERVWSWYTSTFYTRRSLTDPKGCILLIMTRWHPDDLAGRLIQQMKEGSGEKWIIVSIPAEAKENDLLDRLPGAPLWPEGGYSKEELARIKAAIGQYDYSALYQQEPRPAGGEKINRDWFEVVDRYPEDMEWVRFWDLAVSKKETADRVASCAMAKSEDGEYFIRDMIKGNWGWPRTRKIMFTSCRLDGSSVRVGIEEAGQQLGFIDDLIEDKQFANFSIKGYKVDGDKLVRALPWVARAEARKIKLVRGKWVNDFLDEVENFTGLDDPHDDQIDAVSGCYRMLNEESDVRVRRI